MSQTSPKPLPPNHQPKTPNLEPSETLTLAAFKGFVAGSGKHRGCPGADLFEPSRRGFRLVVVTVGFRLLVVLVGASGGLGGWVSGFTGFCVQEHTICACTLSSKMYEGIAMHV